MNFVKETTLTTTTTTTTTSYTNRTVNGTVNNNNNSTRATYTMWSSFSGCRYLTRDYGHRTRITSGAHEEMGNYF